MIRIENALHSCFDRFMKTTISRLVLCTLTIGAFLVLASCTPSDSGDGTTSGFYGPSTANTPDYTENLRSEFRNNW